MENSNIGSFAILGRNNVVIMGTQRFEVHHKRSPFLIIASTMYVDYTGFSLKL